MWKPPAGGGDGDDEYEAFVRVVESTSADDADELDVRLAAVPLPRLRERMARVDEYELRPLRVADPVRHLDNALGFVLVSMGRHDLADGLLRVPRADAYRLIVGYMRAFLLRANQHCYEAAIKELRAPGGTGVPLPDPPVVLMRDYTFRRHMLGRDGPCSHLFHAGGSRWIDRVDRRRVRGAVRHIFADWDAADGGLAMFLVYDQYERLARLGVFRLAPGGRRFARAAVPADPAHRELLRAFVRAQYAPGYLDRLMRSLRRSFAPPFLEALAAAYAHHGRMDAAAVTEAARELNVPWFAEGTETPEPADMYYAHRGFHPV